MNIYFLFFIFFQTMSEDVFLWYFCPFKNWKSLRKFSDNDENKKNANMFFNSISKFRWYLAWEWGVVSHHWKVFVGHQIKEDHWSYYNLHTLYLSQLCLQPHNHFSLLHSSLTHHQLPKLQDQTNYGYHFNCLNHTKCSQHFILSFYFFLIQVSVTNGSLFFSKLTIDFSLCSLTKLAVCKL